MFSQFVDACLVENQRGCLMAPCNCKSWYSEDAEIFHSLTRMFHFKVKRMSLGLPCDNNLCCYWMRHCKGEVQSFSVQIKMLNTREAIRGNKQQNEAAKLMYLGCWPPTGCSRGMAWTRRHSRSTAKSSRVPSHCTRSAFSGNGCSWNYLALFCKPNIVTYCWWVVSWTIIQIIPRKVEFCAWGFFWRQTSSAQDANQQRAMHIPNNPATSLLLLFPGMNEMALPIFLAAFSFLPCLLYPYTRKLDMTHLCKT